MTKIAIFLSIIAVLVSSCGQTQRKQEAKGEGLTFHTDTNCNKSSQTGEIFENPLENTELRENKILTEDNIWKLLDEKVEWFKKGLKPQKDISLLPLDFKAFYEKYSTDSMFQVSNVKFDRLIGVIGECDTTIILNSQNWHFETDIIDSFYEYPKEEWNNYFYSDSARVLFVFEIIEVGVIFQYGFEKTNGKWEQTLSFIDNC